MTKLQQILNDALVALNVLGSTGSIINPDVAKWATIAGQIAQIAKAANDAHVAVAGKPIDLSTLQDITPVA